MKTPKSSQSPDPRPASLGSRRRLLMGNLAVRFPNQQLLWDGENMQVRNHKEANAFVRREYRGGWTL